MTPIAHILLLLAALAATATGVWANDSRTHDVGVLWHHKSTMAESVAEAFRDRMRERAPGVSMHFRVNLPSAQKSREVYRNMQETMDAVVILRSEGAMIIRESGAKVPTFFAAAGDPVMMGVLPEEADAEGLVGGATYHIPIEDQLRVFEELRPNLNRIAFITKRGHPSGRVESQQLHEACEKRGIIYHQAVCSSREELIDAILRLRGEVDAFVIGNQNLVFDAAHQFLEHAGSTPIFSLNERAVRTGNAAAGLVANNHALGRRLADAVIDVLAGQSTPGQWHILRDDNPSLVINPDLCRRWGLALPERAVVCQP